MRGNLLPLNLQFFAADAAADTAEPAAEGAAADVADATGADSGAVQDAVDSAEGKKDAAGGWKEGIADGRVPAADVQKLVQEEMKKAAMPPEERAKYEADEREKSLKEREAAPAEGAEEIEALIAQRTAAKAAKNWAEADRIRDELKAQGIELIDTKEGTTWKRV